MAEEIIKEDNPEEEDTQKGKYMTFKSGHEYFGIEIRNYRYAEYYGNSGGRAVY